MTAKSKPKIKGYLSSMIASKINENEKLKLSGLDLEVLLKIYEFKKISTEDLQKQLSFSNLEKITMYLESNGFIIQTSPWRLTDKGKRAVKLAYNNYKKMAELITSDAFLYSLAKASGTFD